MFHTGARSAVSTLLLILSVCSACGSRTAAIDPLTDEARQEAEKFWATKFAQCGGSYYGSIDVLLTSKFLYQLREPTVTVVPMPVTEADRLNSIEWLGLTSFIPKVYRINVFTKATNTWSGWGSWYDGNSKQSVQDMLKVLPTTAAIGKRKTGWSTMLGREDKSDIEKPDCPQIPQ